MSPEKKNPLDNLRVPNTEQAREMQKLSAKKRSENIKERKRLKEALLFLLDNVDAEGLSGSQKICMALYREALAGNVQAFNSLRDTTGEVIKQQQEINIERPSINIGVARQVADNITQKTTKLIGSKPDESKETDQTNDIT